MKGRREGVKSGTKKALVSSRDDRERRPLDEVYYIGAMGCKKAAKLQQSVTIDNQVQSNLVAPLFKKNKRHIFDRGITDAKKTSSIYTNSENPTQFFNCLLADTHQLFQSVKNDGWIWHLVLINCAFRVSAYTSTTPAIAALSCPTRTLTTSNEA